MGIQRLLQAAIATAADNLALAAGMNVNAIGYGYDGATSDMLRTTGGVSSAVAGALEVGVLAAGIGPGYARKPASQSLTGSGQSATVSLEGAEVLQIAVSGTWVATLTPEVQLADATWVATDTQQPNPINVTNGNGFVTITSNTTPGVVYYNLHANRAFRLRCSAYTSGTAVVDYTAVIGRSRFATLMSPDTQSSVNIGQAADNSSATSGALSTWSYLGGFDNSTWDRLRTIQGVLAGSADVGVLATAVVGSSTNVAAQTTVTNSSTSLVSARAGRRGVLLVNQQNVAVYVDPSGGTAATSHFRLDPGASIFLAVTSAITGITSAAYTASGDAKVHTIDMY